MGVMVLRALKTLMALITLTWASFPTLAGISKLSPEALPPTLPLPTSTLGWSAGCCSSSP